MIISTGDDEEEEEEEEEECDGACCEGEHLEPIGKSLAGLIF